jgi:hypothetical protein
MSSIIHGSTSYDNVADLLDSLVDMHWNQYGPASAHEIIMAEGGYEVAVRDLEQWVPPQVRDDHDVDACDLIDALHRYTDT